VNVFIVEELDPDAWGSGSGISDTKYVRAMSELEAQCYCQVKFGGWKWRARPITILDVDIEGKCDICGEPVVLGDMMCDSCYWNIREG